VTSQSYKTFFFVTDSKENKLTCLHLVSLSAWSLRVRPEPTWVEHFWMLPLLGRLPSLPPNIGQTGKACRDKHSSLFCLFVCDEKSFRALTYCLQSYKIDEMMALPVNIRLEFRFQFWLGWFSIINNLIII
jgi:hypothetical protein